MWFILHMVDEKLKLVPASVLKAKETTRQISVQVSSTFEEDYLNFFVRTQILAIAVLTSCTRNYQSSPFAIAVEGIMCVIGGYALIEQKPAEEGDTEAEEYDVCFGEFAHMYISIESYNPIVTLSVLKLYMLTLPLMPYFCLMSPSAVLMSFTPLVPGRIAHDFFVSLFTRKTP